MPFGQDTTFKKKLALTLLKKDANVLAGKIIFFFLKNFDWNLKHQNGRKLYIFCGINLDSH